MFEYAYSHVIVAILSLHRLALDSLMLPTTYSGTSNHTGLINKSIHIMIALVKAWISAAIDELSNIAPRFVGVDLCRDPWAQTHWDDRRAYARRTVKRTKAVTRGLLFEAITHGPSGS